MKPLCIYHGNCFDGFTAAWAVREHFGAHGVEFHEGMYGVAPPSVDGRDVIIVDFSYKRPVLESLLQSGDTKQAMSILVLDHHETAAADLQGIERPERGIYDPNYWRSEWEQWVRWPVRAEFDMKRSGAGMAWDFFHPGKERPALINHVEDRDLWRFALPATRAIHAAMSARPFDFGEWDAMMITPMAKLEAEGAGILRKHDLDVRKLVEITKRRMIIGGHDVPVGNVAPQWVSDACHLMQQGEPFAAAYYDGPGGRYFSLRGSNDGMAVSEIAKSYGGGGHRNAAGFKAARGWEGDQP